MRLYGATSGSGLDGYASVTVTRGSYGGAEPAFGSCTNFAPDGQAYRTGQAQGTVYAGTLADFPDSYAQGIVDPAPATPETWTTRFVRGLHVGPCDRPPVRPRT